MKVIYGLKNRPRSEVIYGTLKCTTGQGLLGTTSFQNFSKIVHFFVDFRALFVLAEEFHGTSVLQTRSQVDFSSLVKNFGSSYIAIAGKENQIKGRSQDFPPNFFLVSGYIVL